jgi:hypothetical protein
MNTAITAFLPSVQRWKRSPGMITGKQEDLMLCGFTQNFFLNTSEAAAGNP